MDEAPRTSPADQIRRAIAQAQRNPEASDACFICHQKLWISVFFDDREHDAEKEKDTDLLTNIGKLLYAHTEDKMKGIYRIYLNGLGVAFQGDRPTRTATAREGTSRGLEQIAGDKLQDVALDGGKELLKPGNWGADLAGLIARLTVEATGLRDVPAVSQLTLSGAETRINSALTQIERIVQDQDKPVWDLHVAVFGAGFGGAMARHFVNKLVARCRNDGGTLRYRTRSGEAVLHLPFLGLLDCVSSRAKKNVVTDALAGKASFGMAALRVEGPMGIPRAVAQTVHYVAGHELRMTHRIDSVARAQGSFREVALPGNHGDIVGGYAERVDLRWNQLARHALVLLHGDAYAAGVPIWSMEKLSEQFPKLYNEYLFSRKIKVGGVEGGARAAERHYGRIKGSSLEATLLAHQCRLLSWMRLRHETLTHPGRPLNRAYDLVEQQIHRIRTMVMHPHSTYQATRQEVALLTAWAEPESLDAWTVALFDEFVHEELFRSSYDLAAADALNHGYFSPRGLDASDELEEETADTAANTGLNALRIKSLR